MRKILMAVVFLTVLALLGSCAVKINKAPSIPSNPYPQNDAIGVHVDVVLSWSSSDPDGDTILFDLYIGEDPNPPLVASNLPSNSYKPRNLDYGTTYYWKVVAKDSKGAKSIGPLWRFTTERRNSAPNAPTNPNPADNAVDVSIDVTLSWDASDPDEDPLKFDVYFGTTSNPPLVARDITAKSYDPGTLDYSTTYYWKVVVKDDHGHTTEGPVWKFTTMARSNPPVVRITSPEDGAHFTTSQITVKGDIENFNGNEATLYLNSVSRTIPVNDGHFEYTLILEPGENHIKVEARNDYGTGSDEITVYYDTTSEDALWIELTWDKDLADVDLYVYEPDGQVVWYANTYGHGELDYDDTDGYGPEHYTLKAENAIPGEYRIRVHYYAAHGQTDPVGCRVVVKKYGEVVIDTTFTLSEANSGNDDPSGTGPDWHDVGSVQIEGNPPTGYILIDDDFESYSVGDEPNVPWGEYLHDGNAYAVISYGGNPGKAVKFVDPDDTSWAGMRKSFNAFKKGILEVDIRMDDPQGFMGVRFWNMDDWVIGPWIGIQYFEDEGKLYIYTTDDWDKIKLQEAEVGRWYRIKVVFDLENSGDYEVYIDGVYAGEGRTYTSSVNYFHALVFSDRSCSEAYIDNLKVTVLDEGYSPSSIDKIEDGKDMIYFMSGEIHKK